ncbi:hypothetical protein BaRGS_00017874, partial [Batillaria attramentaria]
MLSNYAPHISFMSVAVRVAVVYEFCRFMNVQSRYMDGQPVEKTELRTEVQCSYPGTNLAVDKILVRVELDSS